LEDTLRETLLDLVRVLQADVAFLALLDEQRNLWPRLHVGPAGRTPGGPPQPLADAISTKVLDARRPLAYDGGDVFGLEEATEGICAPLLYRGNLLGVVHVLSLSRHQFLPIEVSFLSVVAVQLAGLIVDNEQLVESQGRADALAFLNRLNSAMQGQSDPDGVARVLLAEARQRSAAQGGGVWLWNEAERGYLAAVHGLPSDSAMSLHSEMEALLTRALDSETGYLLVPSSDPCGQNDAPRLLKGVGSVLVLPLRSPESRVGALVLTSSETRSAAQWPIQLLRVACDQAVPVIQRAELCRRLEHAAEREQLLRLYYEGTVAAAPLAIEIIDKRYRIIGWNRACEELTGIPRDEALGADKFELQPGLLKQNGREILAKVIESGQVFKLSRFPYERRDGTVRYADLTFVPFVARDGQISAVLLFAQELRRDVPS
jgi:PAS domain S-box-containing protein